MFPSGRYRSSKKNYGNRNEQLSSQLLAFFNKKVTLFTAADLVNNESLPIENDDSVTTAMASNLSTKVVFKFYSVTFEILSELI